MSDAGKYHDGHSGWIPLARDLVAAEKPVALAIIVDTYGSTPREAGSWILVSDDEQFGTIGGGNLEYQVIASLREGSHNRREPQVTQFILGPDMAQCCGGALDVLFQELSMKDLDWLQAASTAGHDKVLTVPLDGRLRHSVQQIEDPISEQYFILPLGQRPPCLALFGAGHVGAALCQVLQATEWQVLAADTRAQQRQDVAHLATEVSDLGNIPECCSQLPEAAFALVMTHSHELDYEICSTLLRRSDLSFVGLIGSKSKAVRFRHNLKRDGFSEDQISRLTSPIGISGLVGKHPGTVALAAAAQIARIESAKQTYVAGELASLEKQ